MSARVGLGLRLVDTPLGPSSPSALPTISVTAPSSGFQRKTLSDPYPVTYTLPSLSIAMPLGSLQGEPLLVVHSLVSPNLKPSELPIISVTVPSWGFQRTTLFELLPST